MNVRKISIPGYNFMTQQTAIQTLSSSKMNIEVKDVNDVSVIKCSDTLDFYTAPEFKKTINRLISLKKNIIILNLEKTSYIDSTGIGVLFSSMTDLKKNGGNFIISNMPKSIQKIFSITQVYTLFDIYETEEDALKSLNG